jgi:hypothetical protein
MRQLRFSVILLSIAVAIALTLGGCSSQQEEPLLTKTQTESLLFTAGDTDLAAIHGELNSGDDPVAFTVGSYTVKQFADMPAFNPAQCRAQALRLILLKDKSGSGGAIWQGGRILMLKEKLGKIESASPVEQYARYFTSAEAAKAWVAADRAAKNNCADYTIAGDSGPIKVHQDTADTGLQLDGFISRFRVTTPSVGTTNFEEWMVRNGNAILLFAAPADSPFEKSAISGVVRIAAKRLSSKIDKAGAEVQTRTEACAALTSAVTLSGSTVWDKTRGVATKDGLSLDETSSRFATAAALVRNAQMRPIAATVASDLAALVKVNHAATVGASGQTADPRYAPFNKLENDISRLGCYSGTFTLGS